MKTWVFCTFQFEAFHKWKDAVKHPELDVAFLSNLHRHIMHVKVQISVDSDDREIEFIALKRKSEEIVKELYPNKVTGSCEMIAEQLLGELSMEWNYPNRDYIIEVSEDGENGAVVEHYRYIERT